MGNDKRPAEIVVFLQMNNGRWRELSGRKKSRMFRICINIGTYTMSRTPSADGNATDKTVATASPTVESPPAKAEAKPMRIARAPRKAAMAAETHVSIEEQTAAFLKSGGKIDEVPRGVSGQQFITRSRPAAPGSKPVANPAPTTDNAG